MVHRVGTERDHSVLFPKTLVFHWSALCLGIAALLAFFERDPSLR